MKAAVLYELHKPLVIEDVELDDPKEGEVKVRIAASGICATDLHVMEGFIPRTLPLVPGHEGAGIVETVGKGVTRLQPGDHVIISLAPSCGHCFYCEKGSPKLCERMPNRNRSKGTLFDDTSRLHARGRSLFHYSQCSTFAEHAVVPELACVKVRKDAPLDRLCLVACGVITGVGAVWNTAKVTAGSSVAVFGCGGIGLNIVQAAAISGARTVIGVDVLPNKLEWATQFGATHIVNASKEDPIAAIQRITTRGVDYAFEAIGNTKAFEQAFASTRPDGACVVVGVYPAGSMLTVNPTLLNLDRKILGSTYGSARPQTDIPLIVDMYMEGKLKLDELVTHRTTLSSLNDAISDVRMGKTARTVIVNDLGKKA